MVVVSFVTPVLCSVSKADRIHNKVNVIMVRIFMNRVDNLILYSIVLSGIVGYFFEIIQHMFSKPLCLFPGKAENHMT